MIYSVYELRAELATIDYILETEKDPARRLLIYRDLIIKEIERRERKQCQ